MSRTNINKLTWLINTITMSRKISFSDINKKWVYAVDISFGQELLKRTFHKWKQNINDLFGLEILCDRLSGYNYYISNISDIKDNSIEKWLLSTCSVANSLVSCRSIKNKIILENISFGEIYLEMIIDALNHNRQLEIIYLSYLSDKRKTCIIEPYCLKIFKRRWYIVARSVCDNKIKTYSLDRIKNMTITKNNFVYPKSFVPEQYFQNCYGIIVSNNLKIEHVVLKVNASQANYLRDVPLLPNNLQVETERNQQYSIFELDIYPTFDFMQELLTHMDYLEVLQPMSLREEIALVINKMNHLYSNH